MGQLRRSHVAVLLLVGASLYLYKLGVRPLYPFDEGIYANAAKALATTDQTLVPVFSVFGQPDGGGPFLEKPPLFIWAQALAIAVLGPTVFAARLPAALSAVCIGLVTYWIATEEFSSRAGLFAAGIVLPIPPLFVASHGGRFGSTDPMLVLFGTLFVYLVWSGNDDERRLYLAGVFAALAVLTKGVAAAVFGVVLLPAAVLRWRAYDIRALLAGAGVAVLLSAPWFVYAFVTYGEEFVRQFFVRQVVNRATGEFGGEVSDPPLPWMRYPYFREAIPTLREFAPIVAIGTAASAFDAWRDNHRATYLFLGWWALTPVVTFALLNGNHIWYILPYIVPLSLLAGRGIDVLFEIVLAHVGIDVSNEVVLRASMVVVVVAAVVVGTVAGVPHQGNRHHQAQKGLGQDIRALPADEVIYAEQTLHWRERTYPLYFYARHDFEKVHMGAIANCTGPNGRYLAYRSELEDRNVSYTVEMQRGTDLALVSLNCA
jgi:4-amino-4-deoxy-L-arabinose transferase-like glycosyltransferase